MDFDRKSNEFMLILAITAYGMVEFSCAEDPERDLKVLPIRNAVASQTKQ